MNFYMTFIPNNLEGVVQEGSYLIREEETHFTLVSVNTKEKALECFYKLLVREKSLKRLEKKLKHIHRDNTYRFSSRKAHLEGRESQATLKRWAQERENGRVFDAEVQEVVRKAVKDTTPINSIKKKVKRLSLAPNQVKEVKKEETASLQKAKIGGVKKIKTLKTLH